MAKPIKLTEELQQQALAAFINDLKRAKMVDGTLNFFHRVKAKEVETATIILSQIAYAKMLTLISSYETEVAWHGVCSRVNDNTFLIEDILVYPQIVTGGNVEMDDVAYGSWLGANLQDERFSRIYMQGHSHVNYSVTPSAVDVHHQKIILDQLGDDMFYIFMIWNKKLAHTTCIYDMQNNICYEDKDITYVLQGEEDFHKWLSDSRAVVKTPVTKAATGYPKNTYGVQPETKAASAKPAKKKSYKNDDDEAPAYYRHLLDMYGYQEDME